MSEEPKRLPFHDDQAWVTYINPFTIVRPDKTPVFTVPLNELNSNTYDHGKLCEIVTTLPLKGSNSLAVLVCFDGGLAIPRINSFVNEDVALNYFNQVLCALLLGGIKCEAVDRRDVVWGELHKRCHIWPVNPGQSLNSHVHCQLRMRMASSFDTIRLSSPHNVTVSDFTAAFQQGWNVLNSLGGFTPTFLLRGFTALRYHNWSDALANLWVCTEQLTSTLWTKCFLSNHSLHPNHIKRRIDSLSNDNRTWSTSVRQEILWQIRAIDEKTFVSLFPARKARNDLVHDGKDPDAATVLSLYDAVLSLIVRVSDEAHLGISTLHPQSEHGPDYEPGGTFNEWEFVASKFVQTI